MRRCTNCGGFFDLGGTLCPVCDAGTQENMDHGQQVIGACIIAAARIRNLPRDEFFRMADVYDILSSAIRSAGSAVQA